MVIGAERRRSSRSSSQALLKVVNHFNKAGHDTLSLASITQAGSREWVDSWVLVSKRRGGDPSENDFRLRLRVGSRQWGERDWDLDLNLGTFNEDTFAYEGQATWSISEHDAGAEDEAREEGARAGDVFMLRQLDQPFTRRDAEAKMGWSEDVATRRLGELVEVGDVESERRPGRATLYTVKRELPDPPPSE